METFTIILLSIVMLLCLLEYMFYYTPKAILFNKIPGPYKLPVVGNIFLFLCGSVQIFSLTRHLANKYKKVHGLQVCHNKVVNIYNPEDIEIVLSSSRYIEKSGLYSFLYPWLGEGLLTSGGKKWHHRRKILTPAFHFNILRQFCKTFVEQSQLLIKNIKSRNGESIDVVPVITQFAINSICETAMGTQIKSNDDTLFNQYKRAVYDIGEVVLTRLIQFWLQFDYVFRLTPLFKKQEKILPLLHGFTTSVIRQRRKERESGDGVQIIHNEDIESEDFIKSSKKRLAMLDLLLSAEAEGKIDEMGIREEVDTFMFEGHDTTSVAICFALMNLANHKDVQDKIIQEMNDIFEDSDRAATMEDLNNMKYLELCIKESLRLCPSVPFIARQVDEEVQLTDYLIPAGTDYHIHIFDIHRDPSIYPSPDDFIPERFTLENCAKRHPFAYVPFSAGPRNCIGQRFAMYELKSVISSILRNFILEAVTKPKDIVFSADLVLRSRDPIYVKFVPRN